MVSGRRRRWKSRDGLSEPLHVLTFSLDRLNGFYPWRRTWRKENFHIFYPKKVIITSLIIICGIPSFLVPSPISSHEFSVALAVSCFYFSPCFSMSCIMIYRRKRKRTIPRPLVPPSVHSISPLNKFVSSDSKGFLFQQKLSLRFQLVLLLSYCHFFQA